MSRKGIIIFDNKNQIFDIILLGVTMFEINIWSHFSAAHRLDGYQGECANLHGHNWKVRLGTFCKKTNEIGMTIDFKVLKKQFEKLLYEFDHKYLNDLEIFSKHNPTSEFIAKIIFEKASAQINNSNCKVKEIEVWESDKYSVVYSIDETHIRQLENKGA